MRLDGVGTRTSMRQKRISSPWPHVGAVRRHWAHWRPEWRHDRPCWYWYLTFDPEAVADAVGEDVLQAVRGAHWLDPVPIEWTHLTLCDLGFLDQVPAPVVERAIRGVDNHLAAADVPALDLGPLMSMDSALVLAAEPLDDLRRLQQVVRSASEAALGPHQEIVHQHEFWPHVSLGYVNRSAPAHEVHELTREFRVLHTQLHPSRLVLAAVTRHRKHYEWSVHATIPATR